jgi:signal transduction histidine kinase
MAEGVGADRARVWLLRGDELTPVASWSRDGADPDRPDDHRAEVRHQGELLGALSVTMPANDPLDPTREKLIGDVAAQAGLLLRNVTLIDELRSSRRRLVAAQDQERRRLERNIHDGAQQQLVALSVKARLARSLAERDPARTVEMLAQIESETHAALEDLRDLARGIYPPRLADQGLTAAIESQARRSPVPVVVRAETTDRFAPDLEAGVYFSVLEALQNVAKYAEATSVTVTLHLDGPDLCFGVTDDGRGFDPARVGYGTGLQGIVDRLAALGGSASVTSAPGGGTTVAGRLPARPAGDGRTGPTRVTSVRATEPVP